MTKLLQRLFQSRYRVATQLYLAFGGAVALTLAASLVGWFALDRVGDASARAVLTSRVFLLAVSALCVVGTWLVVWLLVRRGLLARIEMLAVWLRCLAGGDLEARVAVSGNDEVAELAVGLELFRRHALELRRLSLVEGSAEDRSNEPAELEQALIELQLAREQVVAQQKLASLGELTAGVAHEIRNPLNFVKNFSESSAELLTELQETLEEGGDGLNEGRQNLVREIVSDLHENLERIRSHGERANRIVHDMLMLTRGSVEFQSIDVNSLLDEHARLAYHSARATDPNFQLDLRRDLDPELGELDVVPQDLGRVFLNMVSNACYATNERQVAARLSGEDYSPTVRLTTRGDAGRVEISIWDNGNGMPPEVVERMFNPFFTTKPTDQGTGLGLSISSDIVRQHGGAIRVNTEPGEFTEMLVELPRTQPATTLPEAGAEP